MKRAVRSAFVFAAIVGILVGNAHAQSDDAELAKQLSNPVGNLISVPFQNNWDCCFGPKRANRYLLNIQPVIPIALNQEWNLVVRTIIPFASIGSVAPGVPSSTGFGDITQSFFFVPAGLPGGVTLGIGPVFNWPIGNDSFGTGKWGAGPTAVILKQEHGWTYGLLANHVWSYAGSRNRTDVSSTFLQPFLSYSFPDTTNIGINSESTYDWVAKQWLVPVGVTVGRLFKLGEQRVQFTVGARYYVARPENGPTWGARFVTTFLFPTQ